MCILRVKYSAGSNGKVSGSLILSTLNRRLDHRLMWKEVSENAIYGYVLLSAFSRKCNFGHNFWTKAHGMMILVSRTMFWGSRIDMAPFFFSCTWPCLISNLENHQIGHYLTYQQQEHTQMFTCAGLGLDPQILYVYMLAKYGCIMLTTILQKHVMNHNFWIEVEFIGWWFWCPGLCFEGRGISLYHSFWQSVNLLTCLSVCLVFIEVH